MLIHARNHASNAADVLLLVTNMKMLKFVLFAIVALLLVAVKGNPFIPRTSFQVLITEEPCVRQGGRCLLLEDCAPDAIAQLPQLCPQQHHMGVWCCY